MEQEHLEARFERIVELLSDFHQEVPVRSPNEAPLTEYSLRGQLIAQEIVMACKHLLDAVHFPRWCKINPGANEKAKKNCYFPTNKKGCEYGFNKELLKVHEKRDFVDFFKGILTDGIEEKLREMVRIANYKHRPWKPDINSDAISGNAISDTPIVTSDEGAMQTNTNSTDEQVVLISFSQSPLAYVTDAVKITNGIVKLINEKYPL